MPEANLSPVAEILPPVRRVTRPKRFRKKIQATRIRATILFLKAWSWRLTAIWIWLHIISRGLTRSDKFFAFESGCVIKLEHLLSIIGFNPTNSSMFPMLLKSTWFILLTGFSIFQLLWFFSFYLITFPLGFTFYCFYGKRWRTLLGKTELQTGLRTERRRTHVARKVSLMLLVAWLLLFAGSHARLPNLLGVILAGLFFIGRSYSAFAFTGPTEQVKGGLATVLMDATRKLTPKAGTGEANKKSLGYLRGQLKLERLLYASIRRITLIVRGSRGKNRASMFVLLQYTFNLVILGAATILFWATAIHMTSATFIQMDEAVVMSAARVLPGLESAKNLNLPLWVDIGSSVSAWILFVVYAGPTASIFPSIQQSYVAAIVDAYGDLRGAALNVMRHTRDLETRLASRESEASLST